MQCYKAFSLFLILFVYVCQSMNINNIINHISSLLFTFMLKICNAFSQNGTTHVMPHLIEIPHYPNCLLVHSGETHGFLAAEFYCIHIMHVADEILFLRNVFRYFAPTIPFDNTVLQYYTCLWCINLLSKLIVISCLTQLMKIISDNSVVSDFSWKLSTGITNTRFYKSVDIIAVFVRGNVYMS